MKKKHSVKRSVLKETRMRKGLTQAGLASLVGLKGAQGIWNIENGFAEPSLQVAFNLAEVLNISIYKLFPEEVKNAGNLYTRIS